MSRYYYQLIFINTISNSIIFLPKMLIQDRFDGAAMSIVWAIPFGTLLLYLFTKSLMKFESLSMPEILKNHFPRWLQLLIMCTYAPLWYVSGISLLSPAVDISKLLINPEMPLFLVLVLLIGLTTFVIRYQARTILFGLEIFSVGILGGMLFIYIRSLTNLDFNWDSVMEVGMHSLSLPSLFSFAAATYSFTGYLDMVSFNQAFTHRIKIKYFWLIPVSMLIITILSFIIPIGLLGAEAVGKYQYPLITATDSLSLETGIIERVFIIFLVMYMLINIINIIVHWKVSLDLITGLWQHQFGKAHIPIWPILLIFAGIPFFLKFIFNDYELFFVGKYWITLRIVFEVLLVGIYMIAARRKDTLASNLIAKESQSIEHPQI
ncbi:GerAB/ArcD/ProY family transporter [Paenibacillus agricola]|uniref:GerAB/ArcD/ProY family transporter n=1 Tax=Paenibacillus agricola TaxID=2716264 RepID=A0ABX0JH21_9BACL|nr:GerAB/ArcD/ProY family transporter [Paenibacillus agricola]NHN32985.1 GerAB/ArcD/ProY family transporter [Paenibacillus agricola]